MSNEQDIKEVIAQLERLHICQSELLQRLGRLSETGENTTTRRPDTARALEDFIVGDTVRIRNPGVFLATRGTIIKIGISCITVQAQNGTKIVRAPKNLILE
jgi:hypothetical protein